LLARIRCRSRLMVCRSGIVVRTSASGQAGCVR
jgi:hypothetical protein